MPQTEVEASAGEATKTNENTPSPSSSMPSLSDVSRTASVTGPERSTLATFTPPGAQTARPKEKQRRLPIGAEVTAEGLHVRVWAPRRNRVEIVIEGSRAVPSTTGHPDTSELSPEGNGYFSGLVRGIGAGTLYRFRLDGESQLYPDPASRFQPTGPHGPSQAIDPSAFRWTDTSWRGLPPDRQIIYEMHIGTFTREGTWRAAQEELAELARLGITTLEVMPVADFPGRFGWGYDGVNFYAPTRLYGEPDDFRRFVDAAHAVGLAVILDVVYNHVGPDGNYLKSFAPQYFTDEFSTEWGEAINFSGPDAAPVREFFVENAGYWIDEYHLDGLRLDATQSIYDRSPDHILAAVGRRVRERAGQRSTIIVAENEPQHTRLVRHPEQGGYGLDALWNDDFHHSAMVALTGRNEAYYCDYLGSPQEFISAAKWGYLYQGQYYSWQKQRRGTSSKGLMPENFVTFIQNHDQIANSGRGARIHELTSPGCYRAMTALFLLMPGTPMLFQGQEFSSSSPFLYFADHNPELAALVQKGRAEFLRQFPSLALPDMQNQLTDPADLATFECCKLDFGERERNRESYELHRDLLHLRRQDPVLEGSTRSGFDGAVIGPNAFVIRMFASDGTDRLLLVNFGIDLHLNRAPEPLLAPPDGLRWEILWSSENPRYGGTGTPELEGDFNWRILGHAAVLMIPRDGASENGL